MCSEGTRRRAVRKLRGSIRGRRNAGPGMSPVTSTGRETPKPWIRFGRQGGRYVPLTGQSLPSSTLGRISVFLR